MNRFDHTTNERVAGVCRLDSDLPVAGNRTLPWRQREEESGTDFFAKGFPGANGTSKMHPDVRQAANPKTTCP